MKRTLLYFLLLFLLNPIKGQDYISEENKAINDIFLDLVDTSFYFNSSITPLLPDYLLIEMSKNPDCYLNDIKYYDSIYYPFEFSRRLSQLKDDPMYIKILDFKSDFEKYCDSIQKTYDKRELLVFIRDTLFKMTQNEIRILKGSYKSEKGFDFLNDSLILDNRYFDFNTISNIGKFVITDKEYCPQQERISTVNIHEIGLMILSRIAFNNSFDKGILFYTFHKSRLWGYGSLIFIEKINNKWIIKANYELWISKIGSTQTRWSVSR